MPRTWQKLQSLWLRLANAGVAEDGRGAAMSARTTAPAAPASRAVVAMRVEDLTFFIWCLLSCNRQNTDHKQYCARHLKLSQFSVVRNYRAKSASGAPSSPALGSPTNERSVDAMSTRLVVRLWTPDPTSVPLSNRNGCVSSGPQPPCWPNPAGLGLPGSAATQRAPGTP